MPKQHYNYIVYRPTCLQSNIDIFSRISLWFCEDFFVSMYDTLFFTSSVSLFTNKAKVTIVIYKVTFILSAVKAQVTYQGLDNNEYSLYTNSVLRL